MPAWRGSLSTRYEASANPADRRRPAHPGTLGAVHSPGAHSRRASRRGFLSLSLARYLELLDWTGRQIRLGKRGAIPQHLDGILERIGLDSSTWCELVHRFGRVFKRAAGTAESMAAEATRRGQHYLQSPGSLLLAPAPD